MTAYEWRVALEGDYTAAGRYSSDIRYEAPSEDVLRLPVVATSTSTEWTDNAGPTTGGSGGKKRIAKSRQRLANRVDIAVRFGIYAGFAPYENSIVCQWGDDQITRAQADSSPDLWAEVVWELSVLQFRLEILELDRVLLPMFYLATDKRVGADREAKVCRIWNTGGIRIMWHTNRQERDPFSSPDSQEAQRVVLQMFEVMSIWPTDYDTRLPRVPMGWDRGGEVFETFRAEVFAFYAKTFHSRYGRLPQMPLVQPESLSSRLNSAVSACT